MNHPLEQAWRERVQPMTAEEERLSIEEWRRQLHEQMAEESAKARRLIAADADPTDLNLVDIMCDEHERQRLMVAERGECDGRCLDSAWMTNIRGELVCKWTRLPCVKHALAELIELFSIVNWRD